MTSPSQPSLPSSLDENDLANVVEALVKAAAKYKFIGLRLGVPYNEIEKIAMQSSNLNECLYNMLAFRLKQSPALTWGCIDDALTSKTVAEDLLAKQIREARVCIQGQVCSTNKESQRCVALAQFIGHVKHVYKQSIVGDPKDSKWPIYSSKIFVNLAIIESDDHNIAFNESDEYTKAMIIDGSVDTILKKKKPIQFCDVAKDIPPGNVILVEGAPGVGKSTFAWEFCRRWERGEIAQQYQLVLLLRLRDKRIGGAKNVSDLIPVSYPLKDKVEEELNGVNTLIILEGFDELSHAGRSESSIFMQLISGEVPSLLNATVLVTSRHWATSTLRHKNKNRILQYIEILGFTETQIHNYITSSFKNDKKVIDGAMSYLQTYPQIKACMYIPLNTVIVIEVYRECSLRDTLPKTLTELYSSFTRTLLLRYLYGHPIYSQRNWRIQSEKDLPQEVHDKFLALCKVAYEGIYTEEGKEVKLVFSNLPDDFDSLGFMQSVAQVYISEGEGVTHNFLHLTLQEFLAAKHIHITMSPNIFEHFEDQQTGKLNVMQRFLAGLTKLEQISPMKFKDLLSYENKYLGLEDEKELFVYKQLSPGLVLHSKHADWMFEAQLEDIDFLLSASFNRNIEFILDSDMPLLAYYSLGYCIIHSNYNWMLAFRYEDNLTPYNFSFGGSREIAMVAAGARTKQGTSAKVVAMRGNCGTTHYSLSLSHEALNTLFTALGSIIDLQELCLNLPTQCDCISWPRLTGLNLLHIEIVGQRNWKMNDLLQLLSKQNLRSLTIRKYYPGTFFNEKTLLGYEDCSALACMLNSTTSLQYFHFTGPLEIDSEGLKLITKALSQNRLIAALELECKCTFSDEAAENLVAFVKNCNSLRSLSISYCEFTADKLLKIAMQTRNVKKRVLWEFRCAINSNAHIDSFQKLPVQLCDFNIVNYLCVICKCSDHIPAIINALLTPKLKRIEELQLELNFSNVRIGENEIPIIADIVHKRNIARLNLSGTSIDDDGVQCLAECFEYSSLQELILSNNEIGDSGVQALAKVLHTMVLTFLDLSGNAAIDKDGTIELMKALAESPYGEYEEIPCSQQSPFFSTNEGIVLPENVREYSEQSQYTVRKLKFC